MKIKLFVLLAAISILCFTSCYATMIESTTVINETTDASTMESFHDSNTSIVFPVETEYVDYFTSFLEFPNGRGYFFDKITLYPEQVFDSVSPFILFRVLDIEDTQENFIIYHVNIVEAYGLENYNTGKVYRMAWRGHLDEQLYGRPPLEIGKVYGRFLAVTEESLERLNLWQAALIFSVEEQNGKCYIYGYGIDLSDINCKIKITDKEENSIYKVGKHDKTIAYLRSIGQSLPTFDYKCDLDEFYAELQKRCP